MPPHSSHLLQSLDISCFGPLKHYYGQKICEMMQNSVHVIDKREFLSFYQKVHSHAFSKSNILSGFAAASLIPFKSERELGKLHIKIKSPTPPSSSSSNQSSYLGRTPANLYQLNQQKKDSRRFKTSNTVTILNCCRADTEEGYEGCRDSNAELYSFAARNSSASCSNKHQKEKKKLMRTFIQDGGSLTGSEGQQRLEERKTTAVESSRPWRPARCSNCNQEGHNRLKCPIREQ